VTPGLFCFPRSPKARDLGHPFMTLEPTSARRLGHPPASIPGPQKRGTGGTLIVVRDRGHPPPSFSLDRTEGSGPPAPLFDRFCPPFWSHIYISRAQIAVLPRAPVSGSGMLRSVIESVNGTACLSGAILLDRGLLPAN
jgi:hypothetical protein